MAKIRITLTKSPIGYNKKQRATAEALGLRKLQSSVIQEDTPDIMGKVAAIAHLVKWERLAEAAPVKAAEAPAPQAAEAPAEEAPKRAPRRTAKKDAETADELTPAVDMVSEALKQAPKRAAKKDSEAAPQEQE